MEYNLLWSEGRYILLALVALGALGVVVPSRIIIGLALAGFLFSWYFFRNPVRVCAAALADSSVIICPADGKVVGIEAIIDPFVGEAQRVSIFLSPFDVHVQWSPLAGAVAQVNYRPGKFIVAYAPKSSDINECNDVCMITDVGAKVLVRQIAGFVARRICCWVCAGERLHAGQKYGMIRFGSRVDVIVPRTTKIAVCKDQRVVGGQTVLGTLSSTTPDRTQAEAAV